MSIQFLAAGFPIWDAFGPEVSPTGVVAPLGAAPVIADVGVEGADVVDGVFSQPALTPHKASMQARAGRTDISQLYHGRSPRRAPTDPRLVVALCSIVQDDLARTGIHRETI